MRKEKERISTNEPFYKKWWFWFVIAIVVVSIIVGSVVGVIVSGKKIDKENTGGESNNNGDNTGNGGSQVEEPDTPNESDNPSEPTDPEVEFFTVTFKNYDGTILETQEVEKGFGATAPTEKPIKPVTEEYRYTFIGWSVSFDNITSDLEVVAKFSEEVREFFTVTFKNYDGTVLETQEVEKGFGATAPTEKPIKPVTEEYRYTFIGWSVSFDNITSDLEVVAEFSEEVREFFTVTFKNYDGIVLETQEVEKGFSAIAPTEKPIKEGTETIEYYFSGWDKSIENVTSNMEVVAVFIEIDLTQFTFTLINNDTEYSVKAKDYTISGDIVIPSKYMGKPVTTIESGAFRNCGDITSVIMQSSVINIGSQAFYGCSGLTSVTISNSVTYIVDSVFRDCKGLTSVTFAEGSNLEVIAGYAFSKCSSLISIVLPESVTHIGRYAFFGCSSLISIVIPESVTSIESNTFSGCSSLTINCPYTEAEATEKWGTSWFGNAKEVIYADIVIA